MENHLYNRVARHRRPGQRGFTLIELLVVIAVLAVLAAIVIFNVVGVTDKGKTSGCKTDVGTVQTAVDAYFNQNNTYPVTGGDKTAPLATDTVNTTELVTGSFIHSAPTTTGNLNYDPANGKGTIKAASC